MSFLRPGTDGRTVGDTRVGDLLPPTLGPPAVDQPHVASHRHDVVAGPRLAPHSPHRRHSLPAGDRLGTPPQRGPEGPRDHIYFDEECEEWY